MSYQHWILTIPEDKYEQPNTLPEPLLYIRGQLEEGEGGFRHWQIYAVTKRKIRTMACKSYFPKETHVEPTRSAAARAYVWKEQSAVGLQFEFGQLPIRRNVHTDWTTIKTKAQNGLINELPDEIFVRHYRTLKAIEKDYMKPIGIEKKVYVYWGKSGAGKSKLAWEQAGMDAYPKDPNTKYWDGYSSQENVVMDEFRGRIDIGHMLRWLDRYPVCVETKFGGCVLKCKTIYITSNLNPRDWYPDLDNETKEALLRRLIIKQFT